MVRQRTLTCKFAQSLPHKSRGLGQKRNIVMKKSIAKILVAAILALVLVLAACDGTTQTLVSESGAKVTGNLPQDAVFVAEQVGTEDASYTTAVSALGEDYDLQSSVYVWDLHLAQNGQTIQPESKVKVSLPFEGNAENCDLLHVSGGVAKVLSFAAKGGQLIFETDGFSPFVLAKRAHTPDPDPDPAQTYTFSAITKSIVQHGQNNGGYVVDANEEYITGEELKLEKDSQYTATARINNDYYFLG